ncbi:hypothetical protein [Paraburkholderia sp. MM5477-R1]|uniref:hypothetical protein n=1 Tax=Paraburkholderia sp. MM5477-R1 TaxID=2991062 RepID=UPI003D23AF41
MLDLPATAATLEQFVGGDVVLRDAAVLSTRLAREVGQWTLEPLCEIRVGATEYEHRGQGKQLLTVDPVHDRCGADVVGAVCAGDTARARQAALAREGASRTG